MSITVDRITDLTERNVDYCHITNETLVIPSVFETEYGALELTEAQLERNDGVDDFFYLQFGELGVGYTVLLGTIPDESEERFRVTARVHGHGEHTVFEEAFRSLSDAISALNDVALSEHTLDAQLDCDATQKAS